MATAFMLVGLPGSGKTTFARKLETERNAIVLAPDEWMAKIVRDGYDATRREAVKDVQLELAERILRLGVDVVLEFGFLSREERDLVRAKVHATGASTQLIFLDVPFSEIWRRVEERNRSLPSHTFAVSLDHLKLCAQWLEPPQPDEVLFCQEHD